MTPHLYEIAVRGRLGPSLVCALEGFDVVESRAGETRLRGWIVDLASLYGALETMASLGLELTTVALLDESG